MRLEDLPNSILRQILNGENSWAVLELWKCGNRAFNKGVTVVELTDLTVDSSSRWPRCLKELSLESLVVSRGLGPLGSPAMLQSELKKLSSTLKELKITGNHVAKAFFAESLSSSSSIAQEPSNGDTEANEEPEVDARPAKRSKLAETDDAEPHAELWNLGITWPHLETLSIKGDTDGAIFSASALSMLPRSLTYYDFPHQLVEGATNDLSCLPSGLKMLLLHSYTIDMSGLLTLPKSITHLDPDSVEPDDVLPKLADEPEILPNLSSFPCRWNPYEGGNLVLEHIYTGGTPSWPHSVTHLPRYSCSTGDDMFTNLPPKLTSLQSALDCYAVLSAEYLADLPKTLQNMRVPSIDWTEIDVKDWPENLTDLVSEDGKTFDVSSFAKFPRSLVNFEISGEAEEFEDEEDDDEKKQPLTLEELLAIGRESLKLDYARWNLEKKRLLAPHLLALGSAEYIKRVENGELFGLPLGLMTLAIDDSFSKPHRYLLPPHIQADWVTARVDNESAFDHLPPYDTLDLDVQLYGPKQPSSKAQADSEPTTSALYRNNYKSISVSFSSPVFERRAFKFLPRTITSLRLSGPKHIYSEELLDLPPRLVSLQLGSPIATPSEPWIAHLPKTLTSLDVVSPILGPWIEMLPPLLETIVAPFFNVTLAQARQLPHQLRSLTVLDSETRAEALKGGVLDRVAWCFLLALCRPVWRLRDYSEAYLQSELDLAAQRWKPVPVKSGKRETTASRYLTSVRHGVPQYDANLDYKSDDAADEDGDGEEGSNEDNESETGKVPSAVEEDAEVEEESPEAAELDENDYVGPSEDDAEGSDDADELSEDLEDFFEPSPMTDIDARTTRRFASF